MDQPEKSSSDIDPQMVRHIGILSRIELTDEQARRLGTQMSAILESFDKLNELDTDGVEPMAHATDIHNVFAEDRIGQSLPHDQALSNAPDHDEDFFKVPKVIGD